MRSSPANRAAFAAVFGLSLLSSLTALAQLPTAQLTTVFPPGGKAGSLIEVRVNGTDLDDVNQILFSHAGLKATQKVTPATEFEKSKPQPSLFGVEIAADVPPGVYEARVVGRFGVSNPRAFVVGSLVEANDPGNSQPANALAIAVESTMNGLVDGNQVDYFKLPLKAGQHVLIDCQAQRIDSRLDGVLLVFDASGKELARARSTVSRDPLIDFTAPADGEYRVTLHDFTYRGGGEYFYRLTTSAAPTLDFIFPPSGLAGSNETYTVYGRNLPNGQPADGFAIGGASLQKLSVNIPLPSTDDVRRGVDAAGLVTSSSAWLDATTFRLGNSNPIPVYFAKGTVVRETEPNNAAAQSMRINAPCEVVGQFYPATDIDTFSFAATKGQIFQIEVLSHRLGLDTDPVLVVQKVKKNEKGDEVAQDIATVDDPSDRANRIGSELDTSTDDPEYQLTVDEDATYRVTLRDQFGDNRVDPRAVYRLAIHQGEPDFRLLAYAPPVVGPANANAVTLGAAMLRKGGSTLVELRLDRRYGFAGEVEVTAEGLPAGITCSPVILGANSVTGSLILQAAENAAGWAGAVRIVGRARVRDFETIRYARNGIAVWNSANRQQEFTPFRLARDLVLAVIDRETQPAIAQVAEDKIWETSRGGKLEIPIKVTRRGDFKEDLNLAPMDIQNELKPANLAIKGAEAEGKLQFAATNGNAKPGIYTFYLRADTKLKHSRNPDAVAVAEQEQKEIDATIVALNEKNKQATDAKNAAVTVAQSMANAAKQAELAKVAADNEAKQATDKVAQTVTALNQAKEAAAKDAANQALKDAAAAAEKIKTDADAAKVLADQKVVTMQKALLDAQAAAKSADEAKAVAEKAAADADAKVKAIQAIKQAVDKRLADAKTANNPKDLQFPVISSPIKVRVVETCLKVAPSPAPVSVKAGDKAEALVKVERLYGFDDAVEVTVELPGGTKGITVNKLTIAKGQAEGKLEIVAAKDATIGELTITARAKAKFNNVENQTTQSMSLRIDPAM